LHVVLTLEFFVQYKEIEKGVETPMIVKSLPEGVREVYARKVHPLQCTICPFETTLRNLEEFKSHVDAFHFEFYPVQCRICFERFQNESALEKHDVEIHHVTFRLVNFGTINNFSVPA